MPTLSSSIVKHNAASVSDVEEAIARQAMYGGDLVTNLLELSAVREAPLAQVLAESYEAEVAPVGELPSSAPDVLRLVPKDLARRFGLYPLERRDDALLVAVAEPLPAEVESDLGFSLGLRIEQRLALAVRIHQALARDYALPLEQRSERILAKLAGRPDPNPSVIPSAPTPAPAPVVPQLPEPPVIAHKPAPRAPVDLSSLARKERKHRRLGPYTPAMAERDLLEATDTEDVLRAFFDFASQYFEYSAMFALHGDLAEGRDAAGSGAPRARVLSLGIPLDLPSALSRAAASDRYSLLRLGTGGLDGALARDLDRRPGPQVLMLPIRVRKRTVLVLYGDHGAQDVELDAVGQVISFAPLVSNTLEHLILKRKQAGMTSLPPRVPPQRPPKAPLPRPEERAAALASALGASDKLALDDDDIIETAAARPRSEPPRFEAPRSEPPRFEAPPSDPPPASRPGSLMRPVIAIGDFSRKSTPAQGSLSATPKPTITTAQPAMESIEPPEEGWDVGFPSRERGTHPGMGLQARKLELVPEADRASQPPDAPTQVAMPAVTIPEQASPEAPEISVAAAALEDELDMPPDSDGVPLAPASRSLAHSARPLPMPKESAELRLPTVIVDLANDCQILLDQLLAGSSSAGDKLVQIGEPAVAVLAGSFPGPITAELRRGVGNAPSRASECGPVLRTLARIGVKAAPVLVVRTADSDPNVRAWATRLLGEMPGEDSARAIVRRFIDDEQEVRRAALAAGRLMQGNAEARAMIHAGLAELLSDSTRPEEQRHALIEAIADLRDGRSVPTMMRLLDDRSNDIVRSAHWALVVLTRQDYGMSQAAWDDWWRRNSARHRIEWLIDALSHESSEIRRAAGDELKSTTKEYFGYYDDLPVAERQKAQNRYRDWWETKGKARFR
ncbi:MAG TPA: HEAT repeat domain-containing protein [Polyangiaceae bacterium]|nr:HEAT repeat domain-containing protein [Polyangiaceae bacterium]